MKESTAAIRVSGLTKRFGRTTVLHDLSLDVSAGEIYGFLGPNGAGKTTTISCLMDFIRPSSGSIELFGQTYAAAGAAVHRQIGYVPADPQLYGGLTGRQHLDLYGSLLGGAGAALKLADRLNLDLKAKAKNLSTGNQQKLALVLALAGAPRLLILDEPTRGLDPLVQDQVYSELNAFRDAGGTVFISSHNLAEVQKICDRVGLIKDGRLAASSSLTELLKAAVHEVHVSFTGPYKLSLFHSPHMEVTHHTDRSVHLRVKGDINTLITELHHYELADLEITHASLDEVFAKYYREDSK